MYPQKLILNKLDIRNFLSRKHFVSKSHGVDADSKK